MSTQSDPLLHDHRTSQAPQELALSHEYEHAFLAAR